MLHAVFACSFSSDAVLYLLTDFNFPARDNCMWSKRPVQQPMLRLFSLAAVLCLTGVSFWLLFGQKFLYRIHVNDSTLQLPSYTKPNYSLPDLLSAFGIGESVFNLSALPLYARMQQQGRSNLEELRVNDTKLELLTDADVDKLYDIVHRLHVDFSRQGLELFLAGGSLLGSVRHLGFIPWDADADVMILTNQKPAARQILMELSKSDEYKFSDTERSNGHWQLGVLCRRLNSSRVNPRKQCKTIVDFFFGRVESGRYRRIEAPYSFPLNHVYPLGVRPFGPHMLPVPNNPQLFLAAVYGQNCLSECLFKYFNNRKLNCFSLRNQYPFVNRLLVKYKDRLVKVDILVKGSNMTALFIPVQRL